MAIERWGDLLIAAVNAAARAHNLAADRALVPIRVAHPALNAAVSKTLSLACVAWSLSLMGARSRRDSGPVSFAPRQCGRQ